MKLKITESINRFNGLPIFMVYRWGTTEYDKLGRWAYLSSFSSVEAAREFMELQIRLGDEPLVEKFVEEFEG